MLQKPFLVPFLPKSLLKGLALSGFLFLSFLRLSLEARLSVEVVFREKATSFK